MEEMKGVQERAQKFSKDASSVVGDKTKMMAAEAGSIARRSSRSLGDIIALIFKIFAYFILGCIGFAAVVGLFAFGIFSIGMFPIKDFVLNDGWQNVFAWGTLIFFIAVPIIGIITWIIRRLARIKTSRKAMRISFISLWIVGWFCFISLIASVGKDFRYMNSLNEQEILLSNPTVHKLEITTTSPDQKFFRNHWFRMEPFEDFDEDTAFVKNVSVHIVRSPNDSFKVTMLKMVRGGKKRYADTLAALMNFNVMQRDSLLLIDKGIGITRENKFRNQRIVLTVYVPVGKQIRVNRNVGWGYDIHFDGPFNSNDWDVDFEDVENGWDSNVDYVMKEDGLYTLDGRPADKDKYPRMNSGMDIEDGNNKIKIDQNGIIIHDGNGGQYRYDNNRPGSLIDSLKLKLDMEQKKMRDSLQKAKERIDRELERISNNSGKPTAYLPYSIPAYNPLFIMN
jgi:hypothetical protein